MYISEPSHIFHTSAKLDQNELNSVRASELVVCFVNLSSSLKQKNETGTKYQTRLRPCASILINSKGSPKIRGPIFRSPI